MANKKRIARYRSSSPSIAYEEDKRKFFDWIGVKEAEFKAPKVKEKSFTRYIVINDLHVPFHNLDAITAAVNDAVANSVDEMVIGGDVVDCYALSRFSKHKTVPIKTEFKEARLVMEYLASKFGKVTVLSGNHDERERKHFSSRLTADEVDWLLTKPMLERCIEGFDNIELHHNIVYGEDLNWFKEIGDVIVGHPEKSSKLHLKPVEDFRHWVNMWGAALKFNAMPKLIVIGHTHQAGVSWSGTTMIVENGCMCQFQEYSMKPNLYPKPQRLAYIMFDMVKGKVQRESVDQKYPFADSHY